MPILLTSELNNFLKPTSIYSSFNFTNICIPSRKYNDENVMLKADMS